MSALDREILTEISDPTTLDQAKANPDDFLRKLMYPEHVALSDNLFALVSSKSIAVAPDEKNKTQDSTPFSGEIPDPDRYIKPIDTGVRDRVEKYSKDDLAYNPLNFEYMLSSGLELLERCVSYRSAAQDLEARYRSQLVDLLQRKIQIEQFNDRLQLLIEQKTAATARLDYAISRQQNINGLLQTIPTPPAGNTAPRSDADREIWGLKSEIDKMQLEQKLAEGEVRNLDILIKNVTAQFEVDRKLFVATEYYNEAYGNALNFKQRIDRIRLLFDADFEQSFRRLHIASMGMKAIWGDRAGRDDGDDEGDGSSFPTPIDEGYLDLLMVWAKKQAFWYDQKSHRETYFTVAYSLNSGVTSAVSAEQPTGLLSTLLEGKPVSLKLDKTWFFNASNVRLKGIRLGVVLNNKYLAEDPGGAATRWQAVIVPPIQKIGSNKIVLSNIVFGAVAGIDSEEQAAFDGPELNNADPFAGDWQITMNLRAGGLDYLDKASDGTVGIRDVVIEWNVVGEL